MKDSFDSIRSNVKIKLKLIKNYSRQLLTKIPLMCVQQTEQLQLGKAMMFQLSWLLVERDNMYKRNPQIIKIKNPLLFLSISTSSLTHSCEDLKECSYLLNLLLSPLLFFFFNRDRGVDKIRDESSVHWESTLCQTAAGLGCLHVALYLLFCFSLPCSVLQEADLWTYGH